MTKGTVLLIISCAYRKPRFSVSAPSSEQSAALSLYPKGQSSHAHFPYSSSQKSHFVAIFGSPVAANFRLNSERVNAARLNNRLQKQKSHFFVGAVGCSLASPLGAMLAGALRSSSSQKSHFVAIFGSPFCALCTARAVRRKGVKPQHSYKGCALQDAAARGKPTSR